MVFWWIVMFWQTISSNSRGPKVKVWGKCSQETSKLFQVREKFEWCRVRFIEGNSIKLWRTSRKSQLRSHLLGVPSWQRSTTDVEGLINLDSANFDKNLWSVHLHDQCPATFPTWSQAGVVQDTEYVNLCGPEG